MTNQVDVSLVQFAIQKLDELSGGLGQIVGQISETQGSLTQGAGGDLGIFGIAAQLHATAGALSTANGDLSRARDALSQVLARFQDSAL